MLVDFGKRFGENLIVRGYMGICVITFIHDVSNRVDPFKRNLLCLHWLL